MNGQLAVLNVGAGDVRLSFDKNNPVERIRAARIVRDMLRRGFALLVEVERDGVTAYERAIDFDEERCEYIIADFDPTCSEPPVIEVYPPRVHARPPVTKEHTDDESITTEAEETESAPEQTAPKKRGRPRKSVPAESTKAVAVSRSAGG